jgi:hypothetical protein
MLYLLAQDTPPTNLTFLDVITIPIALTLLGCVIFYAGWWVENRLTKAPWKWIALAPVGYAIYMGICDVSNFRNPFYYSAVTTESVKKMTFAHYGALVLPLLGLAGIILFHFFNHKLDLDQDD